MHLRIYFILLSTFLLGYTNAEETSSPYWSRDDIYIDDDGNLEGSGGGQREVKDDLESSGSGFGPDDEDAESGSVIDAVPTPKLPIIETHLNKIEETHVESVPPSTPVEGSDNTARVVPPPDEENGDKTEGNDVYIMNTKTEERATSFFAQPGILAAVIGGAVVGLLCAILVVMFIVYRMRKKDEGSYALDEPKRSPTVNSYTKNSNREFFA
ncbi:syndecan isoform X2 [Zootermopsis nevadensis]|uniref:syndecan isoform X2 n=1 Tax=Zootermopsis nevadensis TaxID=136037 RepID=UPI000B8E2903|nr:syndecan isoform X2 [Zootermopsis nevadensis]